MKGYRRVCIAFSAILITILNLSLYVCRDRRICDSAMQDVNKADAEQAIFFSTFLSKDGQTEVITPVEDHTLKVVSATGRTANISAFKTPLYHFPLTARNYRLIILVTSSATSLGAERRESIRQTWHSKWHHATSMLPLWGTFFLLGKSNSTGVMEKLYAEADKHQDIIIGDFFDHFYNLSIKVMVGFEWVSRFSPSTRYILKLDDDVIPILPNVFAFLFDKETPRSGLYAGNVQFAALPLRTGKYNVTREEFSRPYYPRYVSGGGIALSSDVATGMLMAFNMSDYFKIDDVYFGMLALRLGIDPYPAREFRLEVPDNGPCACMRDAVVQHGLGVPACLRAAYERTLPSLSLQMKKFNSSLA